MHFDDRLATVLRVRAGSDAIVRTQYRQLLDLLGTHSAEHPGPQVEAAFDRLSELSQRIAPVTRAAMLADPGLRLRSPRLVAALAADDPRVAIAAVQRADLPSESWLDLIPALPVAARGVVRHRRDLGQPVEALLERLGIQDRGLPAAETVIENIAPELATSAIDSQTGKDGIGAIVKRIEAYRKSREAPVAANTNEAPRLPLGEEQVLQAPARAESFDLATGPDGRIVWADPGVAPMVVGMQPFSAEFGTLRDLRFQHRQPIRAMLITLSGAPGIAGEWQFDAAPQFDPASGGFTGYAGRMRRPAVRLGRATPPAPRSPAERQADRIRQLLHELRTPVSAIQGFAEVIQQQLFGPTPHEYRALAASIAGDAARVLAAFEELERYAKFECGALDVETGTCDLAALLAEAVRRLEAFTGQRKSGFALHAPSTALIALAPIEAERIVWRLLATLAGTAAPGEVLDLTLAEQDGQHQLTAQLPATLAIRDDRALFGAAVGAVPQTIAAGMFGIGFALRLAGAEARAAGGGLLRDGKTLQLRLPGLTAPAQHHTDDSEQGSNRSAAQDQA